MDRLGLGSCIHASTLVVKHYIIVKVVLETNNQTAKVYKSSREKCNPSQVLVLVTAKFESLLFP